MAYRRSNSYRTRARAVARARPAARRRAPARRARSSGSARQTLRIVIEQPGASVARPLVAASQAEAPRRAKF